MEFLTQYSKTERFYTDSGSPVKITYQLQYDKAGVAHLVEKGKINLYNEIQSHADSVDIHVTLKRFANGETDILNQRSGAYGDFTAMPETFAEVLNTVARSEDIFMGLDPEIRANFGNSLSQFIAALDHPEELAAKMQKKKVEKVAEKVDNNSEVKLSDKLTEV